MVAISLLAFLPVSLFAAIAHYENPLGCNLDTIPEFVKAVITIVAKIGIPIGALFLIWAGFLFLTAQGDEGKLSTAKKAFVWSCIGIGVLLGAWTFAVGVEGVIKDIGKGGGGDVVGGGCDDGGGPGPGEKLVLPSVVEKVLFGEKSLHAGLGVVFEPGATCSTSGNGFNPNDVMEDYGLDPDDPDLLNKSLAILHDEATQKTTEQAYVFFQLNAGGGDLQHTASGGATSVEFPPINTIEDIIDGTLEGVESIHFMHTHPAAFFNGSVPPSLPDLQSAYTAANIEPATKYYADVADADGVWSYSVPSGSAAGKAIQGIIDNTEAIASSPEAKAYMDSQGLNECSDASSVFAALLNILNGAAGAGAQNLAKKLVESALPLQPFVEMDAKLSGASYDEFLAIMQQRLELEQSMGVSLHYESM